VVRRHDDRITYPITEFAASTESSSRRRNSCPTRVQGVPFGVPGKHVEQACVAEDRSHHIRATVWGLQQKNDVVPLAVLGSGVILLYLSHSGQRV
jgi:hypothetical protein